MGMFMQGQHTDWKASAVWIIKTLTFPTKTYFLNSVFKTESWKFLPKNWYMKGRRHGSFPHVLFLSCVLSLVRKPQSSVKPSILLATIRNQGKAQWALRTTVNSIQIAHTTLPLPGLRGGLHTSLSSFLFFNLCGYVCMLVCVRERLCVCE